MKKIIYQIIQHLQLGGIESMVVKMVIDEQQPYEHRILVLEGNASIIEQQWPELVPHQHKIFFLHKQSGFDLKVARQLRRFFSEQHVQACHSHHIGPLIYTSLACLGLNINHIHTEHDVWHLQSKKHYLLQYACLKLGKAVVVPDAKFVEMVLQKRFAFLVRKQRLQLIHNGIDTDYFKPKSKQLAKKNLGLDQNCITIGTAGRLETVKAHEQLIKAMAELPENYQAVIAGEGSQKHFLTQLINHYHLQERIKLLGPVKDMQNFYSALDIFCLTSTHEGAPLSLLEAQSCGVPVVTTDVGGCKEAVTKTTGLIVPVNNLPSLLMAIKQLDTKYEPQLIRQWIIEHFSVKKMYQRYQTLYGA